MVLFGGLARLIGFIFGYSGRRRININRVNSKLNGSTVKRRLYLQKRRCNRGVRKNKRKKNKNKNKNKRKYLKTAKLNFRRTREYFQPTCVCNVNLSA